MNAYSDTSGIWWDVKVTSSCWQPKEQSVERSRRRSHRTWTDCSLACSCKKLFMSHWPWTIVNSHIHVLSRIHVLQSFLSRTTTFEYEISQFFITESDLLNTYTDIRFRHIYTTASQVHNGTRDFVMTKLKVNVFTPEAINAVYK